MKLITDVIRELEEIKAERGNLEVIGVDNEEPQFEIQDGLDDEDDLLVVS